MKKKACILCMFVLVFVLSAGFLPGQAIDVSQWPLQEERSRDFDALHYRIWLDLDIAGKAFRGETTVTVAPLRDGFVRFDEGNYLLKEWTFAKSREELIFQLENDDAMGRMWAANELERFAVDQDVVAHLEQSRHQDPFWAGRRGAILILGEK